MPLHKRRDFADLQSRARAALETPADLSPADREALVADLAEAEDRLRLDSVPWMVDIHVAHIDHPHGTNLYAAFSRDALMREVADYCREYWREISDERDPAAIDDEEIARSYFDAHPSEFLQSDRVAIDATEAAILAVDPV